MTSVFFDSNVLIYLVDNRDERKQRIAKRIINAAITRRLDGWVSVQTIAEFNDGQLYCGIKAVNPFK